MSEANCSESDAVKRSVFDRLVMWLKSNIKFSLLTITAFMPLILFMDFGMEIQLFRDFGELKGMGFVLCVIFYSEFSKKYRDT